MSVDSLMKDFFLDSSVELDARDIIFKFDAELEATTSCFHLNYDDGRYREKELAKLIWDTLPSFALTPEEYESYLSKGHASKLQDTALNRISKAKKNSKGDYGELLLFLILEIFENAPKFVSKVKLRSTKKDQIKGYDCAHFTVNDNNEVILWLGEAKFHSSISGAASDAIESLTDHFDDEFIRDEIDLLQDNLAINSKIDQKYYDLLAPYLRHSKSLDDIRIHVPILLTYDSSAIKKATHHETEEFRKGLFKEVEKKINDQVKGKTWPAHRSITLGFYFFPFGSVAEVKRMLDEKEYALR